MSEAEPGSTPMGNTQLTTSNGFDFQRTAMKQWGLKKAKRVQQMIKQQFHSTQQLMLTRKKIQQEIRCNEAASVSTNKKVKDVSVAYEGKESKVPEKANKE